MKKRVAFASISAQFVCRSRRFFHGFFSRLCGRQCLDPLSIPPHTPRLASINQLTALLDTISGTALFLTVRIVNLIPRLCDNAYIVVLLNSRVRKSRHLDQFDCFRCDISSRMCRGKKSYLRS